MATSKSETQTAAQNAASPKQENDTSIKPLSPIKFTPPLKIGLAVLGILFALLFLSSVLFRPPVTPPVNNPSPTPKLVDEPSPPPKQISEFARTADFTGFESDLNQLKADNTGIDLSENALSFPLLDMEVNFNQN